MMRCHGLLLVALSAASSPALAQTGAPLLLQPWTDYGPGDDTTEARFEVEGSGLFMQGVDIDDTDDDTDLYLYESAGRVKLTREEGPGPAIGYDVFHLDLNSDDGALPDRLSDTSIAIAGGKRLDDDWEFGIVGGIGYAGTTPYSDWDSTYFLADLILAKQIDDRSKLTFNLNYNGNRNLWPDLPLPAISYARRSDIEGLSYIVGFPFTSITYAPEGPWELTARYSVPFSFEARVGYDVAENLQAYAAYDSFTRGFWIEDDPSDNDRIFFHQDRVELGFRYGALDGLDLTLAGGYAFNQEFETGWDVRDTDDLRELDAAPYVRVALDFAW